MSPYPGRRVEADITAVFTSRPGLAMFDSKKVINIKTDLIDLILLLGHPSQAEVEADITAVYNSRPGLAMVDSNKEISK